MSAVFSFACRAHWATQWGETIYNARSAGEAKYRHFLQVSDAWPDTKFTDIRVRKVGAPETTAAFVRNAEYRGMPDLRCGHRVKVNDCIGVVVGHDASANFLVLFDDDTSKYRGQTLSVHPSELVLA